MAFPEYVPDHTFPLGGSVLFTSVEEMSRLFSRIGIELHVDDTAIGHPNEDDNDPDYINVDDTQVVTTNVIAEIIQRVSSGIMEYLAPRYDAESVYQIPKLREIATYWAVYRLTGRRNNQPAYEDEYAEGIESLERYAEGSLFLNAPSSGPRANMQSYVVDMRYTRQPIRVISQASSRVVSGQRVMYNYPFFWL